jgi:hypothetical protein
MSGTPITIGLGGSATIDTSGTYDVSASISSQLTVTGSGVTADVDLLSAGLLASTTVENGASLDLTGLASAGIIDSFHIGSDSHLEFGPVIDVGVAQAISFEGADAGLTLDSGLTLSLLSAIHDFHNQDSIVLPNETTDSFTYEPGLGGGALTLSTSNGTQVLSLAGSYAQNQFTIVNGDTIVNSAPCYAAGTRILAKRGEVAVEELRVGDLVATRSGIGTPFKAITWIGWRDIDLTSHPQADLVRPVRIRANALADGLPRRDLVVSPDHALFIDGVLISAGKLVNGVSIVQELDARAVRYFHVELENHDILLAEGVPAESYLDTGNRTQFANGSAVVTLHPNFAPKRMQTDACMPFVENGPILATVRQRLIERVAAQGFCATHDPELRLLVNGRIVRPTSVDEMVYRFDVREPVRELRIVSRSFTPSGISAGDEDCRRLGVCLGGIAINTGGLTEEVTIADPALGEGFYATESNGVVEWRWTNGDARLPSSLLERAEQMTLELRLLWPGSYWTASEQHDEALRLSA